MNTAYFDWSMNRGLSVLFNDDQNVTLYANIERLLDALDTPHVLISECTFESFNIDKRRALLERVHAAGHTWKTFNPRQTPRARNVLGLEKTDDNDVRAIRHVALSQPQGLKPASVAEGAAHERREAMRLAANNELMLMRRDYEYVPAPRARLGVKIVKRKDVFAQEIIDAHLPEYQKLSETEQLAWGNGKKYSLTLIAAVSVAARHAESRKDFDYLTGLYMNGYPSQIRSDVHWWRYRYAREQGLTLSDYRREVRKLYHLLAPAMKV